MSDDNAPVETAPETGTAAPEPSAPTIDPLNLPSDHPLVKAYNAQKEELKQLRPLQAKARQWDEYEEANKTELQKAQDALTQATAKAAEAEARALRSEIARTKNVPIDVLTGADEETLTGQADAFANAVAAALAAQSSTPPAPSTSGATTPSGAAPIPHFTDAQIAAMTPEEYAARKDDIYRARDAGLITL